LVVIACAGAAIAFVQIRSLKSDIALLNRDFLPLKDRLTKLEQAKLELEKQEAAKNRFGTDRNRPGGESRAEQGPLSLTREEIQTVRDFIKPSFTGGPAQPTINVGDVVGGATIPIPSQVGEKIPKLLGARFTTRNGSIIILKRESRQADAVLPPN
jgi:hypothetical protein